MSEDALPNNPNITTSELEALHDDAWRWAYSLVSDRSVADDVMQRTYEEVISGSARFDAQASLKTWLYSVIRHVAYGHFRAERRRFDLLSKLRRQRVDENVEAQIEVGDDVGQALRQLPTRQREVLELVVYREFTLEQCAKIIGIRLGSVRTHYHRAKTTLRNLLEDRDDR